MERIPILKMGPFLLVTIQVDMHDQLALTLQDDLTAKISKERSRGVLIDISALDVVDSFIGRMIANISAMARAGRANGRRGDAAVGGDHAGGARPAARRGAHGAERREGHGAAARRLDEVTRLNLAVIPRGAAQHPAAPAASSSCAYARRHRADTAVLREQAKAIGFSLVDQTKIVGRRAGSRCPTP